MKRVFLVVAILISLNVWGQALTSRDPMTPPPHGKRAAHHKRHHKAYRKHHHSA